MTRTPKPVLVGPNEEVSRLISQTGRTQKQVAEYLTRRLGRNVEHYDVSRMATGARKVVSDEMDALRELAATPAAEPAAPDMTGTGDAIPLFGYANAAGATLRINEDQRVGVVPIRPAQIGSRYAYAFICFGDSVSPRLNDGEIGYANRGQRPIKGQLTVVRMINGDALVKFYDRQDAQTLFLTQLNPKDQKELKIALRDVEALDAVVGASFGRG